MNLEMSKDLTIRPQHILSPSIHSDFLILLTISNFFTLHQETLELFVRGHITPYGYHETKRKNTVFLTGCKISPGTKPENGCNGLSRDTYSFSESQTPGI